MLRYACCCLSQTIAHAAEFENPFVVHHMIDLLDMKSRLCRAISSISYSPGSIPWAVSGEVWQDIRAAVALGVAYTT